MSRISLIVVHQGYYFVFNFLSIMFWKTWYILHLLKKNTWLYLMTRVWVGLFLFSLVFVLDCLFIYLFTFILFYFFIFLFSFLRTDLQTWHEYWAVLVFQEVRLCANDGNQIKCLCCVVQVASTLFGRLHLAVVRWEVSLHAMCYFCSAQRCPVCQR